MMSLLLVTTLFQLMSLLHAVPAPCPEWCPKGTYLTKVADSNGVFCCICKDPCENFACPVGTECELYQVRCDVSPCPPKPACARKGICLYGSPQCNAFGEPVRCGWRQFRGNCAPGYECIPHPASFSGVCCPEAKRRCPRGQVWNECGSACPPSCNGNPSPYCIAQCVPRCECPPYSPILHKGRCITRIQCPKRHR